MFSTTLGSKIQIISAFNDTTKMLSENSMGLYFEFCLPQHILIYFKPLNEDFLDVIFDNEGLLINFERHLIDEEDIEYALDVMSLFNKQPVLKLSSQDQIAQIITVIDLVKKEFLEVVPTYIMLKTVLKVLLLHLIRYQKQAFLPQDYNQKRIFQFLELMETSFLEQTSAEYYAQEIGISVKRLNQILKVKLNVTAKQLIQQRQITEAKRKIIRGSSTTKELAFELGFDSISSFSRFFKNNVGVSPSQFRAEN